MRDGMQGRRRQGEQRRSQEAMGGRRRCSGRRAQRGSCLALRGVLIMTMAPAPRGLARTSAAIRQMFDTVTP